MKSAVIASAFAASVLAAPASLVKRVSENDIDTLQFALALEKLELSFYTQGLTKYNNGSYFAKFGFTQQGFYKNLQKIQRDEAQHVAFLTAAISGFNDGSVQPVDTCNYTFPYTTAREFVKVANILEGVGTAAYLGAVTAVDQDDLTAAGSIMTTEARHTAFLRGNKKFSPFAQAFETPLTRSFVSSLASGFYESCPSDTGADNANPNSRLTNPYPENLVPRMPNLLFRYGQTIAFKTNLTPEFENPDTDNGYIAWPAVTGTFYTKAEFSQDEALVRARIPTFSNFGPTGQAYPAWVRQAPDAQPAGAEADETTFAPNQVNDDDVISGPTVIEVRSLYLD